MYDCQQAAGVLWDWSTFVYRINDPEPPLTQRDHIYLPGTYLPGGCTLSPLYAAQPTFNEATWTGIKPKDGPFGLQYACAMFLTPCTTGVSANTEMCSCGDKACMEGDYCVSDAGVDHCLNKKTFDLAFNTGAITALGNMTCTHLSAAYINNQCCC